MNNQDMKIYFDGSHYIGIPKGAFPSKKGRKRRVVKPVQQTQKEQTVETPTETTKERFEKAYKESQSLPKKERKAYIKEELKDHFDSKEELNAFVDENVERAKTNAIKRKVRLMRKLRLQDWDYFCTFTYSDELHTEESFREKLSNTLKHLVARNGWKYVGVWERGNDTISTKEGKQRLIDGFINAIYLYDDKITFTFNYKDGTKTVFLSEVNCTPSGSDLKCLAAP